MNGSLTLKSRWTRIAGGLAVAFISVTALYLGVEWRRKERLARDATVLEARSGELITACEWERPPVGGPARDCNARDELYAAVKKLFADAQPDQMGAADFRLLLAEERPLPPDIQDFVNAHPAELAAVRESSRCRRACEHALATERFHQGTTLDALRLLLLSSRASPPDVCIATGLDTMRIVEDSTSGMGAGRMTIPTAVSPLREAQRSIVACARRADAETLARAARDAETLAETPPHVGDVLAASAVVSATPLLVAVGHPDRPGCENFLWLQRGAFLDAAEALIARLDTLRAYRDKDLPTLFERMERDLPAASWAPFASYQRDESAPSARDLLDSGRDSLRATLLGVAILGRELRLLAVALAAFRDHAATGTWPARGPHERELPSLCDPLTGRPFGWSPGVALTAPATRTAPAEELRLAP